MDNKEINKYIKRNLIISENLAKVIENSEEEQEIHINRAIVAFADEELNNKLSSLDLEKKKELLWKKVRQNSKKLLIKIIKNITYLSLLIALFITYKYIRKTLEPHQNWSVKLFANSELLGSPVEELETNLINYDWSQTPPSTKVDPGMFSAIFKTCIQVNKEQSYTFNLGSDDGSRLIIDGKKLLENWSIHGFEYRNTDYNLSPGIHHILIEYYQDGGAASLKFEINSKDNSQVKLMPCKR